MEAGSQSGQITLADVARRAGYSRSTASLVFRGSPLVASATRDHVVSVAQQLGYVYNRRAASLRMQRSNTIGLIIGGLANPFFADLTEAVEEQLAPSGHTLLLGTTLDDLERQEALIRTLCEYRVDGIIVVPAVGADQSLVAPLLQLGMPHVILTRPVEGLDSPYVGSDDRRGGQLAGEHLIEHGCSSVAYIGGPAEAWVRRERARGVEEVAGLGGLRVDQEWSMPTKTSSTAGFVAASELLARGHPPDGLVCHSDAIAFGVMRALEDAGLRAGRDTRVVGFDDVELARNWSPSLTSIAINGRQIGTEAVRMLMRLMDNRPGTQKVVLEPSLSVRESCGDEPH